MQSYFFRCLHETLNGKRRRSITVEIPGAASLEEAYARVKRLHPQAFAIVRYIGKPGQSPNWTPQALQIAPGRVPGKEKGSNPQLPLPFTDDVISTNQIPKPIQSARFSQRQKRSHQRTRT